MTHFKPASPRECSAADGAMRQLRAEDGQAHGAHKPHIQGPLVAEAGRPEVHTQGLMHPQHASGDGVCTETGQQVLQGCSHVSMPLLGHSADGSFCL